MYFLSPASGYPRNSSSPGSARPGHREANRRRGGPQVRIRRRLHEGDGVVVAASEAADVVAVR